MPRFGTYDPHRVEQHHSEFRAHLVVGKRRTRDSGSNEGSAHVPRSNLVEGASDHVIAALRAGAKRRVERAQPLKFFVGDFFERVSHLVPDRGTRAVPILTMPPALWARPPYSAGLGATGPSATARAEPPRTR